MAKSLVSDELWELVEPLLPPEPPKPKGGRPRIPDRQVLTGILFVLKTGIPWEDLPKEMNCGSGMTCWRRLRDWQEQGVWECIHLACLEGLQAAEGIDWRRAVLDSAAVRAVLGAEDGPQPYRPGQGWQQASCHNRRSGNPAGHPVNWC
jgi:transposase